MPILPENKHRYPKDWKLRSRFVRFYRAKNRCEWCGCENYQPHPVTGSKVVLTVAHVFDDRPEASGLMNLAALCQRCHNRHDAKDRQRRRKERIHAASGQLDFWMNVEWWHRRWEARIQFGTLSPVATHGLFASSDSGEKQRDQSPN